MSLVVWMSGFCALMQVPPAPSADTYRSIALEKPGDAARGRAVFQRADIGCTECHTVGEGRLRAGPDLLGIGDKYPREELIPAVLHPSAAILTGYAATTFVTDAGEIHSGIIVRRDLDGVELLLATNQRVRLGVNGIVAEKPSELSLMPSGIEQLLAPAEFSDLISYLVTLKQPVSRAISGPDIPEIIVSLEAPVKFEAFHSQETSFTRPIWFGAFPGTLDRFVVVQHNPPEVWLLKKSGGQTEKTLFLSLVDEVSAGSDTGIMGIAFHPAFLENRKYYLYHHIPGQGTRGVVLVERIASEDLSRDSGRPSRRLVHIKRWTVAHTGGVMAFGPDNYLYVGVGDGGPQEDPEGNGQNLRLLLGSILRIDVDKCSSELPYGIPESNPYTTHPDPKVRKEIWAHGFRQPWRFSFDPVTHEFWVGDVGQANYEEISIVRLGENHGWNVYEGHARFSDKYFDDGAHYVPPVVSLLRRHGVSVTGGYVYRGKKNPSFEGVYIFGDFESKRVWGLTHRNRKLKEIREIGTAPEKIVSFGVDNTGELYIVGYETGTIHRIQLEGSVFE